MSSVHLVRGGDPSLVREAVRALIDGLVGGGDRSLMVEEVEVTGTSVEDRRPQLAALVDAAQTPPFLTDKRVVVGRGVAAATAAELDGLIAALRDLIVSTELVLVWESGKVPKALLDAISAVGGVQVDTAPERNTRGWVAEQVLASGVKLDAKAIELVTRQLGEDLGRLAGLLATLQSTYGEGAALGEAEVAPYLGEAGGVAPWDLTDAVDRGDIPVAIDKLHRMMFAGGRHALVVLATLHTHYSRMLALDGTDVRGEAEASAVLGVRGFPAKKALEQGRRLGSRRVAQAIMWLSQADLDLKGAKKLPEDLVMEVLVARLANLSAAAR